MTDVELIELREALVAELRRWREVEEFAPGPELRREARRAAARCRWHLEFLARERDGDPPPATA